MTNCGRYCCQVMAIVKAISRPLWTKSRKKITMSNVGVIGLGYVGLTTALGLASLGHTVTGYDTDHNLIHKLSEGDVLIHEEGLQSALEELSSLSRVRFIRKASEFLGADVEFFFICVPTPQSQTGHADLRFVFSAIKELSAVASKNSVIVLKSSVPFGAGARLVSALARPDVFVASSPEFLREGSALRDFMNPDRILVGSESESASRRVLGLFDGLDAPKIVTTKEATELIKYSSNAYLAMRLSFVNDLAHLCEKTGVSFRHVAEGMGTDSRIGSEFLSPGPGWGGSCFPKDTSALLSVASEFGVSLPLVEATVRANSQAIYRSVETIRQLAGGSLLGKTIGVWGLAFKAGTDDIRESPALKVIGQLLGEGCEVKAYDPVATAALGEGYRQVNSALEAVAGAHVLAVLTEWQEFAEIIPSCVADAMAVSNIFDARGILPANLWKPAVESLRSTGEG